MKSRQSGLSLPAFPSAIGDNSWKCPATSTNGRLHSPTSRWARSRPLSQAATPRNFEIWYNYATGYNPALNQLINQTLEQKGKLSDADLDEIYATYIAVSRASERIDTVNSRMLDEIKQVLVTIDAAAGTA